MTALIEATRESFGDMADSLLMAGAIMPVTDRKTPLLPGSWKDYTSPTEDYSAAYGFAVKTGSVSKITLVDYDSLPPGGAAVGSVNTQTKRGFHQWFPFNEGDTNKQNLLPKVDVRAEGGYAVFHSPHHKVLSHNLQPRELYNSLLSTSISSSKSSKDGTVPNVCHTSSSNYLEVVKEAGLSVKTDWVFKRLLWSVQHAAEGSRNQRFYFAMCQAYGLGMDKEQIEALVNAAMDIGLDGREVHSTAASAAAGKPLDILGWSREWAENAVAATDLELVWVLQEAAVQQHWHKPLFNKLQWSGDSGIARRTLYRHLERLQSAGYIKEHKNPGYLPKVAGAGVRSKPSNIELINPKEKE